MRVRLEQQRVERQRAHLTRELRPSSVGVGREVVIEGERLLNFGSNDYLGLASHPELARAATAAAEEWGSGSGGSRLLGGDLQLFHRFEAAFAERKSAESALLFNSGFCANQAIAVALATTQTTLFVDRLVHASLIDGARLSGAALRRYRHNDMAHLEELLSRVGGEKLIMTESVFSMDGDRAPLQEICLLAQRYGALLLVDEAHADGLLGPRGGGLVEALGLEEQVDLTMSTFGKAYGSFGAAVAGSSLLIDALLQGGRSLIYTTALPAPVVAATARALELSEQEPWRRERALTLAEQFRTALAEEGFSTLGSSTQIVPVVIGESAAALEAAHSLRRAGIWAPAVREPAVPKGTARLRINFTAHHTPEDLERILYAIRTLRSPSSSLLRHKERE